MCPSGLGFTDGSNRTMLRHTVVVKGVDGCPKIIRDAGPVAYSAELKMVSVKTEAVSRAPLCKKVKTRKLLIAVFFVSFSYTARCT
jgi:hypothetical protein